MSEKKITIELSRDGWTKGLQLSINEIAEDGGGDGYRIFGPKFNGSGELIHKHVLDERDATEIRAYLDRQFPQPGRAAPSPDSMALARAFVADALSEPSDAA